MMNIKVNRLWEKVTVAFIMGFILELILSSQWGYNKDVVTLFGVPLFIVLVWTIVLPLEYEVRERIIKKKTLLKDLLFILISLFIIEYIGGSILKLRLDVAYQYPSVLPLDVFMAPIWLLFVYFGLAGIYFKIFDK